MFLGPFASIVDLFVGYRCANLDLAISAKLLCRRRLGTTSRLASEARTIVLVGLEDAGHGLCWRLAGQHIPAGCVLRRERDPASRRPRNDAPLEADFRREAAARSTLRQQVDHLLGAQFLRASTASAQELTSRFHAGVEQLPRTWSPRNAPNSISS